MADIAESDVIAALRKLRLPKGGNPVDAGMVGGVAVRAGNVQVALEVDPREAPALEPLRSAAEAAVAALPGVLSATVVLTGARAPSRPARPAATGAPAGGKLPLPGIRSVVAVASGKGGVGKSTVAVNLAVALAAAGHRTGLLDADIYGPSLPRMMGIRGRPTSPDGKVLNPLRNWGVTCMSIGFLVEEETPMIWRGPMVMSALQQMLADVAWGELDILLVDMPPGTGDAQLTMAQRVPLTGAVIVSTPQDIALLDARKGLNMFRKVDVPVLGIVENMSSFCCPNCGHVTPIFGHGGARAEAERLGVEFLGEVPLTLEVRTTGDEGRPITASDPASAPSAAFRAMADRLWAKVEARLAGREGRPAPRIVIT